MMRDIDAEAWADALELFYRYTFVAVTRREHQEWWYDVASIMRGEAQDPRGWQSLDTDRDEDERRDDPGFPFAPPPATAEDVESCRRRVTELPRSSVETLLVTLATNWLDVSREWEFDRRRPEMERRAHVVLSRFPAESRFYSNIGWKGESPDFYAQPVRSTDPFSRYDWDAGLIAVSDTEVGLVWSFDAT
ncbi:hypothetical protein [Streptomyces sp. ISL-1]|uniref:hypothetical protein n=1 Tax=Streptomyces sp. ISL-1 TaxID=2817657 RepID=UPI0020359577|nr:hypothetical protein [Streptomyces sp. ISL-1]